MRISRCSFSWRGIGAFRAAQALKHMRGLVNESPSRDTLTSIYKYNSLLPPIPRDGIYSHTAVTSTNRGVLELRLYISSLLSVAPVLNSCQNYLLWS